VKPGVVGRAAAESPGAGSETPDLRKTGSGSETEGGVKTKTRVYAVLKPSRYGLRIEQKVWSRYQRASPDPFDVRNRQNGFDWGHETIIHLHPSFNVVANSSHYMPK
jgi:hypothetical protein